ncbi:hypothetical protein OROGR_021446 [Orobanche gracilis]
MKESVPGNGKFLSFGFYPYHYAPFASDLEDLAQLEIRFELGSPFKPFSQLLGVFPAASAHALPEQYRKLMTDPNSPIIDFYPTDFEVDMNGKRFSWQGIAKLPFIDEHRLLAEVEKIEHTLTEEEARRNSMMSDMLFVSVSHTLSPYIFSLDDRCKQLIDKERVQVKERLDPGASGGMNGYISLCIGDPCPPVFRSPILGMEDVMNNQVICAIYRLPDVHEHITRPPPGVTFPKKIVTMGDIKPAPVLWHDDTGRRPFDNERSAITRTDDILERQTDVIIPMEPYLADISERQMGIITPTEPYQADNLEKPHTASSLIACRREERITANQVKHFLHIIHLPAPTKPYQADNLEKPHTASSLIAYRREERTTANQPCQNRAYPRQPSSGYSHYSRPPTPISYSRQPYVPPSHNNSPYSSSQNPRSELYHTPAVSHVREHPQHAYRGQGPRGPQHHGGHRYPAPYLSGNAVRAPIRPGVYYHQHQSSGYDNLEGDRSHGGGYNNRNKCGSWDPRGPPNNPSNGRGGSVNSSAGRGGYNHPRQPGNQFSALGRGGNRRPPPQSDYRR